MKIFTFILCIMTSGDLLATQVCAQYYNTKTLQRDWFFCSTGNDNKKDNPGILTDCVRQNTGVSFTSMSAWADTEQELNKQHWKFAGNCTFRSGRANPYERMGRIIVID